MDIARYIAWLGEEGTVAAISMQPYLSVINKLLQDHARPPVALGPLVVRVRKGLEKGQRDENPTLERLPLRTRPRGVVHPGTHQARVLLGPLGPSGP